MLLPNNIEFANTIAAIEGAATDQTKKALEAALASIKKSDASGRTILQRVDETIESLGTYKVLIGRIAAMEGAYKEVQGAVEAYRKDKPNEVQVILAGGTEPLSPALTPPPRGLPISLGTPLPEGRSPYSGEVPESSSSPDPETEYSDSASSADDELDAAALDADLNAALGIGTTDITGDTDSDEEHHLTPPPPAVIPPPPRTYTASVPPSPPPSGSARPVPQPVRPPFATGLPAHSTAPPASSRTPTGRTGVHSASDFAPRTNMGDGPSTTSLRSGSGLITLPATGNGRAPTGSSNP